MADVLDLLKTLLEDNWISGNSSNRTPVISNIFDVKRVSLNQDYVFLKELNKNPSDNASGGGSKKAEVLVVIDVRTMKSRAQLINIQEEIERIINGNQIDVFDDGEFDINDIVNIQDFSDQSVKLWRKTIDVRFEQFNETIS